MPHNLLPDEFRDRLSQGKYSSWAQGLDYELLEAIIWLLGEICYRPTEGAFEAFTYTFWAPEDWPGQPENEKLRRIRRGIPHPRQSIALEALTEIVSKKRISIEEVMHRLQRYPEISERIARGEVFNITDAKRNIDLERVGRQ